MPRPARLFSPLTALVALLLALAAAPGKSDTRIALVIGNSAYEHMGRLRNPANDAALISDSLRRTGFEVSHHTDLTEDEMGAAIDAFAARAQNADAAAVYFAGHGLQLDGENYLMPVDANLTSEASIAREGIPLQGLLRATSAARVSLVFLDACRNNPFSQGQRGNMGGLAVVRPPGDMLIAYATLPNTTAADGTGVNSPFAEALARHIPTPNVEVSVMMKRVTNDVLDVTAEEQHPQQLTQMRSEFYFSRSTEGEEPGPVQVLDYRGLLAVYPPRVTVGQEVSVVADVPADCTPAFFNLAPDRKLTPIPRRFFKTVAFDNGQIRYEISPGSRYGLVVQEEDAPGIHHLGYLCEPAGMDGRDARAALLRAVLEEIEAGRQEGTVSAAGFAGIDYQVRSFTIQ